MRRRDLGGTGGHQAFFVRPYRKEDDEVEFDAWAKGMKSDSPRSGAWARRRARGDDGEGDFVWLGKEEEEVDSDIPSPKLWEQGGSPVASRPSSSTCASPVRQLSSRQQAIVRYRQEMMDLVSDGPESAYELSLKDMVELPRTVKLAQEIKDKGKGRKKGMSRSDSMEAGTFLLKMFLPFSLDGKGRRKAKGGKVSPKPAAEGEKGADGEWWNSSSSGSNVGSGRRKLSGCYSFITQKKSRKVQRREG